MKSLLIALVLVAVCAEEMLVTREYTDYLKRHVEWEVVDYEDNVFRGWTLEEGKQLLGLLEDVEMDYYPSVKIQENLPSSVNWQGASCIHAVRDQGRCGSCWAFAVAGMLSDRCCLQGSDHGWLSPQELVSCDRKRDQGCNGGWPAWALLDHVMPNKGLVHESCFPYVAKDASCPRSCADGKDWTRSHVCNCVDRITYCDSVSAMKTCLQSGPVSVGFGVCNSFFNYRSGIYRCDCNGRYAGLHAVDAIGYSDTPSCHYTVRNSWGTSWGKQGYFDIACDTCGISGTYRNGNVMCEKVN